MKNSSSKIARLFSAKKGATLILALILLALTSLIIPALVSYVNSGARVGVLYNSLNEELYAADAGVQDGIARIQAGAGLPTASGEILSYSIPDVNGKAVTYEIELLDPNSELVTSVYQADSAYRITAHGATGTHQTTITADTCFIDFFKT